MHAGPANPSVCQSACVSDPNRDGARAPIMTSHRQRMTLLKQMALMHSSILVVVLLWLHL